MTQNEHVYVICCRPEVTDDVISGGNVTTIEGYAVLNFEGAALVISEILKINHFVTSEEATEADIDDSIKRKRFRVSLKN